MNTSAARIELPKILGSWRDKPGMPVYIGPYSTPEAVLIPVEVWRRARAALPQQFPFAPQDGDGRMATISASEARSDLFRLLSLWREEPGLPLMIERYETLNAVLSPISVWHGMQLAIADKWDAESAGARRARLDDPDGARPLNVPNLALTAGCTNLPVPVLQSRGVPRGGHSLAAWPGAIDDMRALAAGGGRQRRVARGRSKIGTDTAIAALQALCLVLLDKATVTKSRCGNGTAYTVDDVNGLHLVAVTTRPANTTMRHPSRLAERPGNGGDGIIELVAVDAIGW